LVLEDLQDVDFVGDTLREVNLNLLTPVSAYITFLDLSECVLTEQSLLDITVFEHLPRLDLHSTNVTDNV